MTFSKIYILFGSKDIRIDLVEPNSTQNLKLDHNTVRRVGNIARKCSDFLYANGNVPMEDLEVMSVVMEEFVDRFHHGKEESAYFPEAKVRDYSEDVRKFLIEHELGRRIARMFLAQVREWKAGVDAREPVARFLKAYSVFVSDHTGKEDSFFDKVEARMSIPPDIDERLLAHYETCKREIGGPERVEQLIRLIGYLEERPWMKDPN
ncbi:MAG: hemerythrin domain-containing protein [Nitrososphaera sp.]|jgi:hemerythrin-like domain-containing protein